MPATARSPRRAGPFTFAHGQTNNNGAINVLSSGNFGPLTITKSISIVADGVEAVINTAAGRRHHSPGRRRRHCLAARPDHRSARHRQFRHLLRLRRGIARAGLRDPQVLPGGFSFHPTSGTPPALCCRFGDCGHQLRVASGQPSGSSGPGHARPRPGGKCLGPWHHIHGRLHSGSITATVRDSVTSGNGTTSAFSPRATAAAHLVMVDRSVCVNNFSGISSGAAQSYSGSATRRRVEMAPGWSPPARRLIPLWDEQGQRQRHRRRADQHHRDEIELRRPASRPQPSASNARRSCAVACCRSSGLPDSCACSSSAAVCCQIGLAKPLRDGAAPAAGFFVRSSGVTPSVTRHNQRRAISLQTLE